MTDTTNKNSEESVKENAPQTGEHAPTLQTSDTPELPELRLTPAQPVPPTSQGTLSQLRLEGDEDDDDEDDDDDDEDDDDEDEDDDDWDEEDEDEDLDEEDEEDEEEDDYPLPIRRDPNELDAEDKVRMMVAAADAVRAEEIVVLDLRELTIIADFFMICTGKSSIQLRAIADRIEDRLRDAGVRKPRIEGYQEATWILLDFGDVVVHLMAAEQREFYRLEEFWAKAPKLELELLPAEARTARPRPIRFDSLTPLDDDDENEFEDDDDDDWKAYAEEYDASRAPVAGSNQPNGEDTDDDTDDDLEEDEDLLPSDFIDPDTIIAIDDEGEYDDIDEYESTEDELEDESEGDPAPPKQDGIQK